jgi:hypothetical protein
MGIDALNRMEGSSSTSSVRVGEGHHIASNLDFTREVGECSRGQLGNNALSWAWAWAMIICTGRDWTRAMGV